MVLFHRKKFYQDLYNTYIEFTEAIADLLESEIVREMGKYTHHSHVTTLEHAHHVAYYTYILAKKFKLDAVSAARGALLHDFFLYDWHEKEDPKLEHTFEHPKIALKNAEMYFELNEIEKEMILMHMWPIVDTPKLPRFKETYLIALVDKFCAIGEVARFDAKLLEHRFRQIAWGNAFHLGLPIKKRLLFGTR